YKQFDNEFVPWLSIIDVMMFNSKERIKEYLNYYYSLI
ncbi:WbqC family protein, partial [bacterium]|nr:WbqC family protein [bacterium]